MHDRERDAGECARWQFALLRIATGHACGVALRRDVGDRHVVAVRRADAQVLMDGRGGRPAMREAGGPVERVPPILNGEPLDKDSE